MVFSKPSIKSYTNKAEMSSNPPEPDARGNRPSLSTATAWSSHCSDIREQLGNPQSIQKKGLEVDPALTHKDSEPAHSLKNALVISNCMQLQQSFAKQILKLLDTSHFLFDPL